MTGQRLHARGTLWTPVWSAAAKRGHIYDRFRNRVMFPIIDVRGHVIAFGGRVLDDSKPKYLNSPETPIFHKSRNLFALNLSKSTKNDYFIFSRGLYGCHRAASGGI